MSYFSQSKGDAKPAKAADPRLEPAASAKPATQIVSTLGHGMLVTGNIVCAGSMHVFGRVIGDIHASQLVICEGAKVEGKIVAPDVVIQGTFNGTVHGNNVKLLGTAKVDGEIFNKSLAIEQNAMFEGVARRLDKAVEAPSGNEGKAERPVATAQVVPFTDGLR